MLGKFSKNLTYTSTTSTLLGYLPPNSIITDIRVTVGTAFNAGTNDYINIGISGAATQYAANVDVSSTGVASVTLTNIGAVVSATNTTAIYGIYAPTGTAPSAGSGYITVEYDQL